MGLPSPNHVTISAGEDSVECPIAITDDEEPESDEVFTVRLALIPGTSPVTAVLGATTATAVTIQDDGGQSPRH